MFVRKGLLSDDFIYIWDEYVPIVIVNGLSLLNERYRGSAVNVRTGAEFPDFDDAA
jgi:hypothetical protein